MSRPLATVSRHYLLDENVSGCHGAQLRAVPCAQRGGDTGLVLLA
ncbi:MAG: hypothetical protein ACRDP1_09795 [Nocardioidaceae bacterium]